MLPWLKYCPNIGVEVEHHSYKPTRAHEGDGGLDCYSACKPEVHIAPGSAELINLGFKIEIPYGYAGFLMSRSGHSKVRVSLANSVGLIDYQYRGLVMARVANDGDEYFIVNHLDRIAQLVIVPVALPNVVVVEKVNETLRGENGFGSTGA